MSVPSSITSSPREPTSIPSDFPNLPVGHSITSKQDHHFRIVLQNPNGISSQDECFEYRLCLQQMLDVSADMIMLSETNLDWRDYNVYKHTNQHRRSLLRHSKQLQSSSSVRFDSSYLPGGVATILANNTVGRFHSSSSDSMGRWTVAHLTTNGSVPLSVITCYQVCHSSPTTTGPRTAYMQQWTSLRDNGILSPNPRHQFINDLDHLLQQLTSQGHHILVGGDFNESIGDNLSGLDRLLAKYNLVDAVSLLHAQSEVPTYSRGHKRLDYLFLTPSLQPALQRSGILPFDTIYISDHRAIFLDLDLSILGSSTVNLLSPSQRYLHSGNDLILSVSLPPDHHSLPFQRICPIFLVGNPAFLIISHNPFPLPKSAVSFNSIRLRSFRLLPLLMVVRPPLKLRLAGLFSLRLTL